jgi:hypothetical protein
MPTAIVSEAQYNEDSRVVNLLVLSGLCASKAKRGG